MLTDSSDDFELPGHYDSSDTSDSVVNIISNSPYVVEKAKEPFRLINTPPLVKHEVIDLVTSPPTPTPKRDSVKDLPDDIPWEQSFDPYISNFHPRSQLTQVKPEFLKAARHSGHIDPRTASNLRMDQPASGPVRLNSTFRSWTEARDAVYDDQERVGHKFRIAQSRRDASGARKKVTLRCNHYHHHTPTHSIDIDPSGYRNGRSMKTDCMAHVNINRIEGSTLWRVTLFDIVHNHGREIPVGGRATRPPTKAQRDVVSQLANDTKFTREHLGKILDNQFPDNGLEPRQISNMIHKARDKAREEIKSLGGDVSTIITRLEERIANGEGWVYHLRLDDKQTVVGLWWQSPEQVELGQRFHDILINDNTYSVNQHAYPLNIGIIIDNHGMSHNAWYALQAKEDIDSHTWVFRCHLDSARSPPQVVASDRHGSIIASVADTMPLTLHIFCLHHVNGNVATQLRPGLGHQWDDFARDFWAAYRAVSPDEFERLWAELITRHPSTERYLNAELYPCRERWAWPWLSHVFTAGVRTNGRVESENRVVKTFGGPKKTILQLFDSLNERTNGQTVKEMAQVRQVSDSFSIKFGVFTHS